MNKQEFLAMSLPYNVYAVFGFIPSEYRIGNYYDEFDSKIVTSMPILHPLSDLTKPITHKGETFVPIVELAKLANFNTNDIEYIEFIEGDYRIICNNGDDERLFGYTLTGNVFINWIFPKHKSMIEKRVENQLDLFLKLIKWHFDLADLIEKGEAIDINTLNENPYE